MTSIEKEQVAHLTRPIVEGAAGPREPGILAEWNIEKLGSHLVWEAPWGNRGEGVVVGFIDTGVGFKKLNSSRNSLSNKTPKFLI